MPLRPEQLAVVGHLYRDSVSLSQFLDIYLYEVEQSSPRLVFDIQESLSKADYILATWFLEVSQRQFLNSGLDHSFQLDILSVFSYCQKYIRPMAALLPKISREPLTKLEMTMPVTMEELLFALDEVVDTLLSCLLAVVADKAYHFYIKRPHTSQNKVFEGMEVFENWCLVLKALENATVAKDWQALGDFAQKITIPELLRSAIEEKDESSYWLQPWGFNHWMELEKLYKVKSPGFSTHLTFAYEKLTEEEKESKYQGSNNNSKNRSRQRGRTFNI